MARYSQQRIKETTTITINKYLLTKAKDLVDQKMFGSVSDVISIALTEFFVQFKPEEEVQKRIGEERPVPQGTVLKKVVFK